MGRHHAQIFIAVILAAAIFASPFTCFAQTPSFCDVASGHWAYEAVERAFREKAIEGMSYDPNTGARYFSPSSPVTVAQFLTILARKCYPQEFSEYEAASPAGSPWYTAVCRLFEDKSDSAKTQLLKYGLSFDESVMTHDMTRAWMATAVASVLQDMGYEMPPKEELNRAFASIPDWEIITIYPDETVESVKIVYSLGIITGLDDAGTFGSGKTMTRAQAATVYCNLSDYMLTHKPAEKQAASQEQPEAAAPAQNVQPEPSLAEQYALQQQGAAPEAAPDPQDYGQEFIDALLAEELELLNAERTKRGFGPLKASARLFEAAAVRAEEQKTLYDHTRPDGRKCLTAISDMGLSSYAAAENIAAGYRSARDVIEGWMNSHDHRTNMLNPSYTNVGLGVVFDMGPYGPHSYKWVQLFSGDLSGPGANDTWQGGPQGAEEGQDTGSGAENDAADEEAGIGSDLAEEGAEWGMKIVPVTDNFDGYTVKGRILEGYKTVRTGDTIDFGSFLKGVRGRGAAESWIQTFDYSNHGLLDASDDGGMKAVSPGEVTVTINVFSKSGKMLFAPDSIMTVILHLTIVKQNT